MNTLLDTSKYYITQRRYFSDVSKAADLAAWTQSIHMRPEKQRTCSGKSQGKMAEGGEKKFQV